REPAVPPGGGGPGPAAGAPGAAGGGAGGRRGKHGAHAAAGRGGRANPAGSQGRAEGAAGPALRRAVGGRRRRAALRHGHPRPGRTLRARGTDHGADEDRHEHALRRTCGRRLLPPALGGPRGLERGQR
ncbi:unnamed protein product, partial [Heterosigma akashiwo]